MTGDSFDYSLSIILIIDYLIDRYNRLIVAALILSNVMKNVSIE